MPASINLARTALWMSRAASAALIAVIVAYVVLWLEPGAARRALSEMLPGIAAVGVTTAQLWVGAVLGVLPVAILAAALWELRAFFALYSGGNVFPPLAGDRLRRLGLWLILLALAAFLIRCGASVLYSWQLGEGHRQLAISISSSDIVLLLFGGLLRMIGRILAEAGRVAEENRLFV
jgi:hypothetical protein